MEGEKAGARVTPCAQDLTAKGRGTGTVFYFPFSIQAWAGLREVGRRLALA